LRYSAYRTIRSKRSRNISFCVHANLVDATITQRCKATITQPCNSTITQPLQHSNHATLQRNNYATLQSNSHATLQPCNATITQPCKATITQPCNATITQPFNAYLSDWHVATTSWQVSGRSPRPWSGTTSAPSRPPRPSSCPPWYRHDSRIESHTVHNY
jgi:hypothetical protein